jgi:chlorite dismutase
LILLCSIVVLIESQTNSIRRIFDDYIYDNKNHYLTCDKLPTRDQVTKIIEEQQNTIKDIEAVNPGLVGYEIDTVTCQGKADIIFWYASHENRLEIEKIIGDETFFGIPYRLQNR